MSEDRCKPDQRAAPDARVAPRQVLRAIPAIHRLIGHSAVEQAAAEMNAPHDLLVAAAQQTADDWRRRILGDAAVAADEPRMLEAMSAELVERLKSWLMPHLRPVINATGVILHTNLGRAPLGRTALTQVLETAAHYTNLEYDLADGSRGSRHSHVEALIGQLTGAEAAMVVNNNAAAVYLVLHALADRREVIVSRGQLVEIGGSFRVSEIMAESGARLVEVGTSNRTHLRDYDRAVTEHTALLMKVHASNFRVIGFTGSATTAELAGLAAAKHIPFYEDLGSGALIDLRAHGIGDEPLVREVLAAGADLVSFSGDKLLGGPQAGIIAGKRRFIERLKASQLARVLRVDKLTLAALEATLRLYLQPEEAKREIPILRDMLLPPAAIEARAERFLEALDAGDAEGQGKVKAELVDAESAVGGGSLPGVVLPTCAAALAFTGMSAARAEAGLRLGTPPILARIVHDRILLDFRTIREEEIKPLSEAVLQLALRGE